ncbi:MAG: hypothetical protein MUF42_09035 [Cytophagaceae bacterium]|nr:hypothetical protein [Cytophagaceae bacterium]
MKNKRILLTSGLLVLALLLGVAAPSCRWLREKRAEHHQPFKPHKEGRMKKGKNYNR